MKRLQEIIPRKNGHTAVIRCQVCGQDFRAPLHRNRKVCSRECGAIQTHERYKKLRADSDLLERRKREHSERMKRRWAEGRFASKSGPQLTPEQRMERQLSRALEAASKGITLGPHQIARMRSDIAKCVGDQLKEAHKAVMGKGVYWTPTQARIFNTLLNKVLPDLHASHISSDKQDDITALSRDELEAIVAEARVLEASASTPGDGVEDAEIVKDEPVADQERRS